MMKRIKGFTLVEMMLVLVIVSALVAMLANYSQLKTQQIVRDRAAIQIAQIDNAALAYYLNYAMWPTYVYSTSSGTGSCTNGGLSTLQSANYLPSNITSPFVGSTNYVVSCTANGLLLTVTLATRTAQDANIIAGMVPGGMATGASVTSYVNIPGQNLNNARAVNAAGVYHNGGCVPVPVCPVGMTPQIYVGVAQIMGTYDSASTNPNLYPITNFTAYATGGASTTPAACNGVNQSDTTCYNYGSTDTTTPKTSPTNVNYWRVCVDVGTQAGDITTNASGGTGSTSWGKYQSLLAITRCAPGSPNPTENAGSDLQVWTP